MKQTEKRLAKQAVRLIALMLGTVLLLMASCKKPDDPDPAEPTQTVSPESGSTEPTEQPKENEKMLHNGIELPGEWPPRNISKNFYEQLPVPYLQEISSGGTHPEVVCIDRGRQLFVDDFLIASTTLNRIYHHPTPYSQNPVFQNGQESGFHMKHGGIWYDEERNLFELWYNCGSGLGYASSKDGIHWTDKGEILTLEGRGGAYCTVIKDTAAKENEPKFYMLVRRSNSYHDPQKEQKDHEHYPSAVYYSFNGQNWRIIGNGPTCGDASSLIYDPFRDVWQFSLRRSYRDKANPLGRCRDYQELKDLLKLSEVREENSVFWQRADSLDERDPVLNMQPEIYGICATGYESIMIGAFQMLQGPENREMASTGIPKITNIVMGYSRDGFHYDRPDRSAFLNSSKEKGSWDRGYLHPVGSVCLIVGDELWFYYSGYEGDQSLAGEGSTGGALNKCSFGLAKLRRDGFASMEGGGTLLTRKMTVTKGQTALFVNATAKNLKAEILDADGNPVEGFSMDDCKAFSGDSTCTKLSFGDRDLSFLKDRTFQIRFEMENGSLYSFWLSDSPDGKSGGETAGGTVNPGNNQ